MTIDGYLLSLKDEVNNISLAMESDYGTFSPRGIGFNGKIVLAHVNFKL